MTQIEATRPRRQKTEWEITDLEKISSVADGLHTATSEVGRTQHFTDAELDTMLPVDLEAAGAKPAHKIWADLKNRYYEYGVLTTPTEQLVSVFAVASDTLMPNRLSTEQRAQKNAQCMRALQSGLQERYSVMGHTSTARDRSEAEVADLLNKSKGLLTGPKRTEYRIAIAAAGLQRTPMRRTYRAAFSLADKLRSTVRNDSE